MSLAVYSEKGAGKLIGSPSAGGRPVSCTLEYHQDGTITLDIWDSSYAGMSDKELWDHLAGRYIKDAHQEPYPLSEHNPDLGQPMFRGVLESELRYHRETGLLHGSFKGWHLLTDAIDDLLIEVHMFRERAEAAYIQPEPVSLIDTLFG